MGYKVKDGVDMTDIAQEMYDFLALAEPIYAAEGVELVVTAGRDGVHKIDSLHYEGKALDLRTRDFKPGVAAKVTARLAAAAGSDYDVLLEGNHIHAEYDPA